MRIAATTITASAVLAVAALVSPAASATPASASSVAPVGHAALESQPDVVDGDQDTWEPAGNYEYTCTGVDGTAYSYSYADLPRCVGYVDVRINGSQIAYYSQTGQTASLSCTLGVGTSIVQIFAGTIYTGWGMASWVWTSYLTGLGCKGS